MSCRRGTCLGTRLALRCIRAILQSWRPVHYPSVPLRLPPPAPFPPSYSPHYHPQVRSLPVDTGPRLAGLLQHEGRPRLHNGHFQAGDLSVITRGTMAVSQGKWYYEVGIQGDGLVQIGWVALPFVQKALGDDPHSWAVDGYRMLTKHNRQHRSLGRHPWRDGDIIGCFLDADEGVIGFTINGQPLRDLHDTTGNGALFSFAPAIAETQMLVPAILLDAHCAVTVLFDAEELLYCPEGFTPLGLTTEQNLRSRLLTWAYVEESVEEAPTATENTTSATSLSTAVPLFPYAERVMESVVRLHDFSASLVVTSSLGSIVRKHLESILATLSTLPQQDKHHSKRPLVVPSETDLDRFAKLIMELEELAERLSRWTSPVDAPWGELPVATTTPHTIRMVALSEAFSIVKDVLPPTFGIGRLQQYLACTNRSSESVKLTLNRRRAASVHAQQVNSEVKLHHSLFGQLYTLIGKRKTSALFMSGRKLWTVVFAGEGADDVGGPYRESIAELCRELMSDMLPFFSRVPASQTDGSDRFVVSPTLPPFVTRNMFLFIGRLIGGCLRSGEPLPLSFPSCFWKSLLGLRVSESDLQHVDNGAFTAFQYLAPYRKGGDMIGDPSLSSLYEGTFEVEPVTCRQGVEEGAEQNPTTTSSPAPAMTSIALVKGGKSVEVGPTNVDSFCQLVLSQRLVVDGRRVWDAIREGFHQVIPPAAIQTLKWYELEQLVCGQPDFSPQELLKHARFEGLSASDPLVSYLLQTLVAFTPHERALFVRFISGRERIPFGMRLKILLSSSSHNNTPVPAHAVTGTTRNPTTTTTTGTTTTTVSGNNAPHQPNLHSNNTINNNNNAHHQHGSTDGGAGPVFDDEHLPHASTCFFWLSIPRYSSQEVLSQKLKVAITQCIDIDADFRLRAEDQQDQELSNPTMVVRGAPGGNGGVGGGGEEENEDDEFEDYHHLL